MPSFDYLTMKKKHPDWVWPRSDTHMVIGVPGSMECYKTWVEPGNSFSPGISSFGVSIWIRDMETGKLYMPETMPLEAFSWKFREAKFPVVISDYECDDVHVQSRLFTWEEQPHVYSDTLRILLRAENSKKLTVYLVVRSYGACGGYIETAGEDGDGKIIQVNDFPLIHGLQRFDAFAAVDCYGEDRDIGDSIVHNIWPDTRRANDKTGWASLAAAYQVELSPKEEKELSWVFPIYLPKTIASHLVEYTAPLHISAAEREERMVQQWMIKMASMEIDVPDDKFREMFHAVMLHMLMMITGDDVRIETSFYPLFWLRDGVYIINAMEKAGYTRLAEKALKRLITGDFYGGFSSEADAPAEGIWALAEHYLFTKDEQWLQSAYPAIRRKAEWIRRMLEAKETIYDYSAEMVTSFIRASMVNGLVCHPAKDGLIQGNMDHHIPLYWINCWAIMGLRLSAKCAQALHKTEDAEEYRALAEKLFDSLMRYYPRDFRETPQLQGIYSFGVALWPSEVFDAETVREEFDIWWDTWRFRDQEYNVAWDWSYFECAQAHNYLLLGDWERYQTILNRFICYQDVPGLYGYNEGKNCANSDGTPRYSGQDWGFGNILSYRGWDRFDCNLPHNWTGSEIFLMLRDALLYEREDTLTIGSGIAPEWLEEGREICVKNAATHFGNVNYQLKRIDGKLVLQLKSERSIPHIRLWIPSVGIDARFNGGTQITVGI